MYRFQSEDPVVQRNMTLLNKLFKSKVMSVSKYRTKFSDAFCETCHVISAYQKYVYVLLRLF